MAGKKGSFSRGSQDAQQFGKSVNTLADALGKASKTGGEASGAISALGDQVGKVNPLLGGLVSVLGLAVAQGEKIRALDLAESIAGLGTAAAQVGVEWERFSAGLVAAAGETGPMAEKLTKLANVKISLAMIDARVNSEIERQTELVKAGTITEEQATSRIRDYVEVERQRFTAATNTRVAIEKEIDTLKRRNKELERGPTRFEQAAKMSEIRQEVRNENLEEEARLEREVTLAREDGIIAMRVYNAEADARRVAAYNAQLEKQDMLWKEFGQGVAITAGTEALNAYYDALDRTVSLNAIFAGGFDRAMRNAAAATVRSVGQQAAVRAIFELAEGWAMMGTPGMQGLAAFHFKSAAIFGGIALGAGPVGGLLSVAPAGGYPGEGGGRRKDRDRDARGATINVTVIGAPDWSTKETITRWVQQVEAEGG